MSALQSSPARPLMGPYALIWLYRRRLRVHAVQEMLAGLGVAIAVALVFATTVAAGSIAGSAGEVVRAVIGPATLQLHSRQGGGMPESVLHQVERLPGVRQAAPILEQRASILAGGRSVQVDLAGADTALVVLDGLGHTLPRQTLTAGGVGLSIVAADALAIPAQALPGRPGAGLALNRHVTVKLDGRARRMEVSAVLGTEAFGALAKASVAVMPLKELQRLSGLQGHISRVLVATKPGREAQVRAELSALAAGRIDVAGADQDVALLRQALRPSAEANAFFATVAAVIGLLFAFNALLLTMPERRRAIADLRLLGVKRGAIVQMLFFQSLALGATACLLGLLGGYLLSLHLLNESPHYLTEAFTLGGGIVLAAQPMLVAIGVGLLAAFLASAVPLLDLRQHGTVDAVYQSGEQQGSGISRPAERALLGGSAVLLASASLLYALLPSQALLACLLLTIAAVSSVPLAFALVVKAARSLAARRPRMTVLPVALSSLRSTTLRSLALAATGAAALFGSVALGGARSDLTRGIAGFASSYSSQASVWVGMPEDNQAVVPFPVSGLPSRIAKLSGVRGVQAFGGGFMQLDGRRVWVLARPSHAAYQVLRTQTLQGSPAQAAARLAQGGWVVLSRQIAEATHTKLGGYITLPTPSGLARLRIAATTTNLAWSPGALFIGMRDYRRLWPGSNPTALAVQLRPDASSLRVQRQIRRLLGGGSGLQAVTAAQRRAHIDALTSEGLSQLGEISTLLMFAAILAMAAALTSAIWQRRLALASLRLAGVRPRRLRLILLVESALILGAGCATGALAGVYGEAVIDAYLAHVTGFPVASLSSGLWPVQVFALVSALVLVVVAVPGWLASRVSPAFAFNE